MRVLRGHLVFGVLLLAGNSFALDETSASRPSEPQKGGHDDLGKLGLEDLMNVKVGGGTMPLRSLQDVTAAVYVLTAEDIRKSGATNVPDMLRMVPGVSVARVDANKWMVSIRGFSSRYADKLQVLIDGRSIYSPAFSGVYWDQLGLMPDEIARIEVIRGSDGAIWGSNAVNGIINIITKNADETLGTFAEEGFSTGNAGDHYVRYGAKGKHNDSFRISARSNRIGTSEAHTYPVKDGSESSWVNFRSDRQISKRDSMTIAGSLYDGNLGQATTIPTLTDHTRIVDSKFPVSDFNVSASMVSQYSKNEVAEFKLNLNHNIRKSPEAGLDLKTMDFGYNRSSKLSESSSLFYGGAFRQMEANTTNGELISVDPSNFHPMTYSAYGQYEKDLNLRTQLTLSSTLEHNPFSGFEFQPSARILYRKDPTESLWFSASRAVKTPSFVDTMITAQLSIATDPNTGLPVRVLAKSDRHFQSESVVSVEAGWRKQASERLLIDLTAFYNTYNNLRTVEFVDTNFVPNPIPHIDANYLFKNGERARTYGLEASLQARMSDYWNLTANISYIGDHFWLKPGVTSLSPLQGVDGSGSVPNWQANVQSSWNLSDSMKFDMTAYYVGPIPVFGHSAYTRLDARAEWQLPNHCQISLIGQNLFTPSHFEAFSSFNEIPTNVRRSLTFQLGYRF